MLSENALFLLYPLKSGDMSAASSSHWPVVYNRWDILFFYGNRKSPSDPMGQLQTKNTTSVDLLPKDKTTKRRVKFPLSISLALFNFPTLRLNFKVAILDVLFFSYRRDSHFTSQWIGFWFTGWLDSWMAGYEKYVWSMSYFLTIFSTTGYFLLLRFPAMSWNFQLNDQVSLSIWNFSLKLLLYFSYIFDKYCNFLMFSIVREETIYKMKELIILLSLTFLFFF